MSASEASAQRWYRFGWPENRTLVAGMAIHQVAILVAGLAAASAVVRLWPDGRGLAAAVATVTVAGAAAFAPVAGARPPTWVRVTAGYVVERLGRPRRRLPTAGCLDGPDGLAAPAPLRSVRLHGHRVADREIGVLTDRRDATSTVLLRVDGGGHQLADLAEKERRQEVWGQVLAGLARAGSPICRVQWVERIIPEDGDASARWLAAHQAIGDDDPAAASYRQLLAAAEPVGQRHDVFIAVAISHRRAARGIRAASGGDDGAATVLVREVLTLCDQLAHADLHVDGVLTPRLAAEALHTCFDPTAVRRLAKVASANGDPPGADPNGVWPVATDQLWEAYRTDGQWHAVFWVAQWPRRDVAADFLAPLLLGTTALRSVSVTLEPIPPAKALNAAERRITAGASDDELRAKGGWTVTAARRHQAQVEADRADELAAGHADFRTVGLITVTAATREELDEACGDIVQHASQSQLEMRRLYGRQEAAFCAGLPLARRLD